MYDYENRYSKLPMDKINYVPPLERALIKHDVLKTVTEFLLEQFDSLEVNNPTTIEGYCQRLALREAELKNCDLKQIGKNQLQYFFVASIYNYLQNQVGGQNEY